MNTTKCHYCGCENHRGNKTCVLCRRRVAKDISGKHVPAERVSETAPTVGVPHINVGTTCMKVMKLDVTEQTGKERTIKIHEGIVVQNNDSFVRIYNPAPREKGGDLNPETSELFPIQSRRIWCEKTAERSVAFPIPPALRF